MYKLSKMKKMATSSKNLYLRRKIKGTQVKSDGKLIITIKLAIFRSLFLQFISTQR